MTDNHTSDAVKATKTCLQCGETRESLKRDGIVLCGVMSGGEVPELDYEWPRHRWADWTDAQLARFGIKSEAFDRHRRTTAFTMQWVPCDDTVAGHAPVTTPGQVEYWGR